MFIPSTLTPLVCRVQLEVKKWVRKYEEVSEEMKSLAEVRKTFGGLQKEIESLINHNKVSVFCYHH